mgnify:CR=1 FL=1
MIKINVGGMNKLLNLFKQKSTWRGLALIATAAGVGIAPASVELIATIGALAVGAVEIAPDEAK